MHAEHAFHAQRSFDSAVLQAGASEPAAWPASPLARQAGLVVMERLTGRVVLGRQRLDLLWGVDDLDGRGERWPARRVDGTPLPLAEWPLSRAAHEGRAGRDERLDIVRPDGSTHALSLDTEPLRDARGRVIAAVGVFRDPSGSARHTVGGGSQLADLDHHLRTPLTVIQARLHLAQMRLRALEGHAAAAEDALEHVRVAMDASERLTKVVRTLRMLA